MDCKIFTSYLCSDLIILLLFTILTIFLYFVFYPVKKPGARVLYLGAASGTTVSHVSDIVGPVSIF